MQKVVFFTDERGMTKTLLCLSIVNQLHPGLSENSVTFEQYQDIKHVTMFISLNPDTIVYLWRPAIAITFAALARLTFRIVDDYDSKNLVHQVTNGEVIETFTIRD